MSSRSTRRNPRRGAATVGSYAATTVDHEEDDEKSTDSKPNDDDSSMEAPFNDEASDSEDDLSDFDQDASGRRRRSSRVARRVSSRNNKTSTNYLESDDDDKNVDDVSEEEEEDCDYDERKVASSSGAKASSATDSALPKPGKKRKCDTSESSDNYNPDDDVSSQDSSSVVVTTSTTTLAPKEYESFKISKVIARRSFTVEGWKQVCANMNTSEVQFGSRWTEGGLHHENSIDEESTEMEERYLIKWSDLSFLHCSWETREDLVEYVDGSDATLARFNNKFGDGLAYDENERCDGDFFDPAWTQIDRVMEVHYPEACPCRSVKDEDTVTIEDLGIVLDITKDNNATEFGRQLLIKWGNEPYTSCTWEYERDLILGGIEYKDHIKSFVQRSTTMSETEANYFARIGMTEQRRLYKEVFGEKSESRQKHAERDYQAKLLAQQYPNGGKLRDYQAEGVAWMISNFLNQRSSILADEMGLGKTIQLASFLGILANRFHRRGPFLVVVPLSTLCNWERELCDWLGLNTIVYHGTAKNRQMIRRLEIAQAENRPKFISGKELYLRKCAAQHKNVTGNPWMAELVLTTPEVLCADDFSELTAIKWECLVVDEAHRLKSHTSKFALNLRDHKFVFKHKILLTGTPIQNNMKELFALLNFVDPCLFANCDQFLAKYGDMQSKEHLDELHEEIQPFILRRLKEDVEKSVPPKEETVIEVELTVAQKQYYRALYEKNVKFLHKNKKKALDGPSLNNLAMQLRKCCNHLFLLNGIEEEYREKQKSEGQVMPEGDLLASASGKLVLLDKLLPRLKENGHRILIFSQFTMMLDVLEDYLSSREVNFERIDGSITGNKRQQAIDRFQAPNRDEKESPFIMLLSTRAGGVGINLTAADTCIIFDSDWNPQNDLQAQARCHRIGQTKNVKVYRLLTAKTYEMQMFHMSSLKMGLDQAVLSGFEAVGSSENALSKDEIERLLRHGAYGILNEEKNGTGEAASKAFVEEDIDSILARSRTVVYDNTGSNASIKNGRFSKARFTSSATAAANPQNNINLDDPNFWQLMLGEIVEEEADVVDRKRARYVNTYSEAEYDQKLRKVLEDEISPRKKFHHDEEDDDDDEEFEDGEESEISDDESLDLIYDPARLVSSASKDRPKASSAAAPSILENGNVLSTAVSGEPQSS